MPQPRPPRQFVFRARRDRQRIAHRLAAGMAPAAVAAVERCTPDDLERLLGDRGFQALHAAYVELMALPAERRRARLLALAEEILTQAVLAGNPHAAAYLLLLTEQGRDPVGSLPDAVERALGRAHARPGPRPPGARLATPAAGGAAEGAPDPADPADPAGPPPPRPMCAPAPRSATASPGPRARCATG
jgi:hypothetical protein